MVFLVFSLINSSLLYIFYVIDDFSAIYTYIGGLLIAQCDRLNEVIQNI